MGVQLRSGGLRSHTTYERIKMIGANLNAKIAQDYKYRGDDYWQWSIWIEGSVECLDRIESVTYTLHRTFRNPVRKVVDRSSKFRLKSAGWGMFRIYARIMLKDGLYQNLTHDLILKHPD